jgi:hypothetical protein
LLDKYLGEMNRLNRLVLAVDQALDLHQAARIAGDDVFGD